MPSVLMSVCMLDFIQVSHELNYPQTYKLRKRLALMSVYCGFICLSVASCQQLL